MTEQRAEISDAYDAAVEQTDLARRVLLLGLELDWKPINSTHSSSGDGINVADFDVVIANLDHTGVAGALQKGQVARLVASGGHLILIGSPLGIDTQFLPGSSLAARPESVQTVAVVEGEVERQKKPHKKPRTSCPSDRSHRPRLLEAERW